MQDILKIESKRVPRPVQFAVRPNTSDAKAVAQVFNLNSYQRKSFAVLPGEKWVDMGANIGAFSVFAFAKGCEVVSYEAEQFNAAATQHNILLNGYQPRVMQAAIMPDNYDKDHIEFYVFKSNRPMAQRRHSVFQPRKDFEVVQVKALKFSDAIPKGFDCVKMNIEGCEIGIIEAAESFGDIRKLVFEWSFDKSPEISVLEKCLKKLRTHFTYVDINRKIPPGLERWTFYPPNAFIYAMK